MLLVRKYINKELIFHFTIIFSALFLIYSSNQLIELLSRVVNGKLSLIIVLKLILLYSPEILSLLIPISLFIAILFVVSKLYDDNEIVILFNAGLGWNFLFKLFIIIATILSIFNGLLTLWICPYVVPIREQILAKSETGIMSSIIPGHFNIFNDGKNVLYVGEIDQHNNLQQIFISVQVHAQDPRSINIITSQMGNLENHNKRKLPIVTLRNGSKYSGIVGHTDFSIINFAEYTKQLLFNENQAQNPMKIRKTKYLKRSREPEARAEYEWRLAIPISTLVLSVIAIGLAKIAPRQGRFAKFLPAILIYIIYSNSMLLMRRAIATNVVNDWIGIWVVHIMFLMLGLLLLLNTSGWLSYFKQKFFKK